MSIRTAVMGRAAWAPAALSGMVSWHAGIIALGAVAVTGILRLLMEWQRRVTLIELLRNAPSRTVLLRDDKDIGSSTRLWVEDSVPVPPLGARSEPED